MSLAYPGQRIVALNSPSTGNVKAYPRSGVRQAEWETTEAASYMVQADVLGSYRTPKLEAAPGAMLKFSSRFSAWASTAGRCGVGLTGAGAGVRGFVFRCPSMAADGQS